MLRSLAEILYPTPSRARVGDNMKRAVITPKMVEQYFSQRLRKVSPATANKNLRTLKAAFNRAVKRGHLDRNPCSGMKQVREPEKTTRVLTPEETEKLLSACPSPRWKALVALAVTTGMRLGEMLALQWEDVDPESGTVWIRNRPGHLTKSRRNRSVALTPEFCAILSRLPRRGEYVFHTREGRHIRNNVHRDFRRIVKKAGIKYCTPHDLRGTCASQLAMAGVNEAVAQKVLGHASITATLKYYTHIMPEALRAAPARLPFGDVLRKTLEDISDTYHAPFKVVKGKTA